MCRITPARIHQIEADSVLVEVEGRISRMNCAGVDGLAVGDFVACYAGIVLERLEPEDAAAMIQMLAAIDAS